jgi:hypothetical protein
MRLVIALRGLLDHDFGKPSQSDKEKPKVFLFMATILLFHIGQFSCAISLYSIDYPRQNFVNFVGHNKERL